MAKCLTPAEIEELLSDKLSPAARTRAENHLGLCAQCRALRDQVQTDEKLFGRLQQADQATDSTETDTDQTVSTPERRSSSSPISLRIAGYEILAEIHSGGQGIVYSEGYETNGGLKSPSRPNLCIQETYREVPP